ncbi:MAG: hypothetical protein HC810_07595 [Acaryochloridaceae cyanobacterium RL_2_7]|nr:hypothetical protein [Acaryochloridaceae cyanobacterium RL_2_7]
MIQVIQVQSNPQVRSLGLLTLGNLLRMAGNYRAAETVLHSLKDNSAVVDSHGFDSHGLDSHGLFMSLGKLNQAQYTQQVNFLRRTSSRQQQYVRLQEAIHLATKSLQYYRQAAQENIASLPVLQAQLLQFSLLLKIKADLGDTLDQSPDLQGQLMSLPAIKQQLLLAGLDQFPTSESVIQSQLSLAKSLLVDPDVSDRPPKALHYATRALPGSKTTRRYRISSSGARTVRTPL